MSFSSNPLLSGAMAYPRSLSSPQGENRKAARPANDPKFAGVTSSLEDRRWVSPKTLQQLLKVSSSPYVGRLPSAFTSSVTGSPKQVFQALDELTSLLRGLGPLDYKGLAPQVEFNIGASQKPVTVQYVGSGGYGTIYKLTIDEQPFALKVYHDGNPVSGGGVFSEGGDGVFSESAEGIYFSKTKFRDLASFYFANPQAGWGVCEFVTPEMSSEKRKGPSIRDASVIIRDDRPENRINGIIVDHGCIKNPNALPPDDWDDWGWNDDIQTMGDFKKALDSGDLTLQADAAFAINVLPVEFREEAFQLAMRTNQPSVQKRAVDRLTYLPDEFQPKAFRLALETRDAAVQEVAASLLPGLSESFQEEAFRLILETAQPAAQATAAARISYLPKEFQEEAFRLAMQTGDPAVQARAVSELPNLPEAFQEEAFKMFAQANRSFRYVKNLVVGAQK